MATRLIDRPATRAALPARSRLRVMVVEDAALVRNLVVRWIGQEPDLDVVAQVGTGRAAIAAVAAARPDVIVLDIEMPDTDGLTALPSLLAMGGNPIVIMMSALTQHQAAATLRALALGASDYIAKPRGSGVSESADAFRQALIAKIRHLGRRRLPARLAILPKPMASATLRPVLRAPNLLHRPRAVVVGASTGGPQALASLLAMLDRVVDRVPVLLVQHMPSAFAVMMAQHLSRYGGRNVELAKPGQVVRAGTIYLAPGERHMEVVRRGDDVTIDLTTAPAENFCRPAVDRLFASAAQVWGADVTALVLTGMGCDGARGAGAIANAGGCVVAQDEASSIVWGMPGAAVEAGACTAVLPLDQMAALVSRSVIGGAA